jgi:serine O-acetyltransferase
MAANEDADQAEGSISFLRVVRSDIEATTHPSFRQFGAARFWLRAAAKLLLSPNVRTVLNYRVAHQFARRGHLVTAMILRARGVRASGAELNPQARIGPGLYLVHSIGVAIGAYVEIGSNCKIHLGVVIGPQPAGQGAPKYTIIGDDVFIGTHAVIMGGVTVGDGAVIGANALVVADVEPHTVVSASPARPIGRVENGARPR